MSLLNDMNTADGSNSMQQKALQIKSFYPKVYLWNLTKMGRSVVFEGSSLTLMGLVKYDSTTDTFQMTQISHVLAGGITDAKRYVAKCLDAEN